MLLPTTMDRFVEIMAPSPNAVQEDMAAYATEHGFPIIGQPAGSLLTSLARARGAERVFEFGSGFGYSASWFLRGMQPGGELVLTEIDEDELDLARRYLADMEDTYHLQYEQGDANAIIEEYAGPFDVVLIDHAKQAYTAAFERAYEKLAPGGVIVADNVMDGPVWYEDLLPFLEEDAALPGNDQAAGVIEYLRTVREHEAVETTVLPIGKGLALTTAPTNPEGF